MGWAVARWVSILGLMMVGLVPQSFAKPLQEAAPKKFDLDCRGRQDRVVDQYIPFHEAGWPKMDRIKYYPAKKRVIIDMVAMKFLEKPQPYSGSPPEKIASYDSDFGLLMLRNETRLARRWAIRLGSYKSTAVMEYSSGEIWVERMNCKVMPFSGFD